MKRNIILIDEDKCNGCGDCMSSCAESALQIVNGKAKLVKDIYCDGLGACLGTCPTGALTIVQREAEAFDEKAVEERVKSQKQAKAKKADLPCGCPGTMVMEFKTRTQTVDAAPVEQNSELTNWPIQLKLVPINAPYFMNADLLIAADCTAFSVAGFQSRFVKGKKLIIACPKLDDAEAYVEKLAQIFTGNQIKSVSVVRMEVPCCGGLTHIVQQALKNSGKNIPYAETIVGIKGDVKK